MTYRLIDGEIHKRNRDGHYMPLTLAEAEVIVEQLNAIAKLSAGLEDMLPNALDLLDEEETDEVPPAKYLRDLAERLMHVPVMYGTDGADIDRLAEIARSLDVPARVKHSDNEPPKDSQ